MAATMLSGVRLSLVVSVVMTVRQRSSVFPFCQPFDILSRLAGGQRPGSEVKNGNGQTGSFLIVLGVLARKAIEDEDDDDDENGKTREFPDRARGRRRARSAGEESNRRRARRRRRERPDAGVS